MKWKTIYKAYSHISLLFHIVVLVIILAAIIPVAMKNITVENVGEATWSFDGENITISVPVTIKNGGFYDISKLSIFFVVFNKSATFVHTTQKIGTIPAGSVKTVNVTIPIDMKRFYEIEYPNFYHFFHYDIFNLKLSVSLGYMLNLVDMNTLYSSDFHWQPIIKEMKLHEPTSIEESGESILINLPYTIDTASYLNGTAYFSGTITGENSTGNFKTKFNLGNKYDGIIEMLFDKNITKSLLTKSQSFKLNGNITLGTVNVPMSSEYMWGAPLNGLKFEVLNNATLHYSFENDASFPLYLNITKNYYYNGSLEYSNSEKLNVGEGQKVNRYEPIGVEQPVDKIVITITDNEHGIHYTEVVQL